MDKNDLICVAIVLLSFILIVGLVASSVYYTHKLDIDNFQKTILNLSDEQKCLHICGFEFHGYFESYKFCVEKCDRISERNTGIKIW